MGLFHNGQVSGEVGVKYLVKAKTAQCSCHLALHVRADGQSEFLAQSRTYGRSCLHNDMFGGICNSCKYVTGVIFLSQSSGRTYGNTLSAGYTGGFSQTHLKGGADISCKPAMVSADHANALYVVTYSHTAAAQDTFAVVADHVGSGVVDLRWRLFPVIISLVLNTQLMSQFLKLAVSAADTG